MHVYTGEEALHEYLRTKAVTVEYWMKPVVEKTALPWLQLEVADCLEAGLIGKAFPAMTTLMCLRFLSPFFL